MTSSERFVMKYYSHQKVVKMAKFLKKAAGAKPKVCIICCDYLDGITSCLSKPNSFSFETIAYFPKKLYNEYDGKFIFGKIGNVEVVCLCADDYEIFPSYFKRMLIEITELIGVKNMIIATIGSGLHPNYKEGDIMMICDHLDLPGRCSKMENEALDSSSDDSSSSSSDSDSSDNESDVHVTMKSVYKKEYITHANTVLINTTANMHVGVYAGVAGSCYETIAEAKMMQLLGGDAMGTSIGLEVKLCKSLGLNVFAFVLLTNCYQTYCCNNDACEYTVGNIESVVKMRKCEVEIVIKEVATLMDSSDK